MIPNPEQIHVFKGRCPKSACCRIEIDHRELWPFWTELQTLAMVSRWEGLLFLDHLSALIVMEMLNPHAWAGCGAGTGK